MGRPKVSDLFESYGNFVTRRPYAVLAGSLLVFVLFGSGLMKLETTSEAVKLWAIRERGYDAYKYMDECCGSTPSFMTVYCELVGAGSIFDRVAVLEMLKVHNWTTQVLSVSGGGQQRNFDYFCSKLPNETECVSNKPQNSLLGTWNFDPANVPPTEALILQQLTARHQQQNVAAFSAEPVFSTVGGVESVVSSRAIRMRYLIDRDDSNEWGEEFEKQWNDVDSGVSKSADASIIRVTHYSAAGIDQETARLVSEDIPLFACAIILVTVFLSLTLGRTRRIAKCSLLQIPDLVKGRGLLATSALLTVLLAAGAGFGFGVSTGFKFHAVCSLLPLIVLGVQVDDSVITVNQLALHKTFAESLRESGPCITTTSLTTVVAFAVGTTAALPGVSYFCGFAAYVFFFGWFFQVTFFYACVILDQRRIARLGCCCCPCVPMLGGGEVVVPAPASDNDIDKAKEQVQPESAFIQAIRAYAANLLHPAVSAAVVLGFFTLAIVSVCFISSIPIGLPIEDILPDDSYARHAFDVEEQVFGTLVQPIRVVVRNQDFNDAGTRATFRSAVAAIRNLSFTIDVHDTWMDVYESWTNATGVSHATYLGGMTSFLNTPGFTGWQTHVRCADASCSALLDARFDFWARTRQPGEIIIDELKRRDAVDNALVTLYPNDRPVIHLHTFMFAETDEATLMAVLGSLGLAIVGVFCTMLLSTSPLIALWVSLCVAMIDVDLLFVNWAMGMQLNSISYICIVMACGLAVDYCVHIGHSFEHSMHEDPELKPVEAAARAVERMGASIFQGGFTTFLGSLVIAFSRSVAFRLFFKFLFTTVFLGVAHGVVLLPIFLAHATPRWATAARHPTKGSSTTQTV